MNAFSHSVLAKAESRHETNLLKLSLSVKRKAFELSVKLSLPLQGVTGIYGASGSGKTTILRSLAGLDRHPATELSFRGRCWQNRRCFVPPHKRPIGYVFQEPRLFSHLSVQENIRYAQRRACAKASFLSDSTLSALGISGLLSKRPAQLSGGEAERVALARALARSPELLLMDEPLSSLDASRKKEILPVLSGISKDLGLPIVYVSHDLHELARLGDRLIWIGEGGIRAEGDLTEILTRLDFAQSLGSEACFLLRARVTNFERDYHLAHLSTDAGEMSILSSELEPGTELRLLVLARDVSLSLRPPRETSIRNILPVQVRDIHETEPGLSLVFCKAKSAPVLARITSKSARELGIIKGHSMEVFAQIKSVAVLV